MRICCFVFMLVAAAGSAVAQAPQQKVARSLDDLPRYSYPYQGSVAALATDDRALRPILAKVKADTEATLAGYAITDRSTLRQQHVLLLNLAMLDGDAAAIRREAGAARALADKELDQRFRGAAELAYADALEAGAPRSAAFRSTFVKAYAAGLKPLPWSLAGANIRQLAGMHEIVTPNMVTGELVQEVQPDVDKGGAISGEKMASFVPGLVFLRLWLPLKAELAGAEGAWIAANDKPKPDIWAASAIVLPPAAKLAPVVVAIWDSGIDASVFPGRMWTNPKEQANGRDDDGDGHVDDVHGIAVDEYGRPSASLTIPVPADLASRLDRARTFDEGLQDQQAGLRTPAARALADYFSTASAADARQFNDDLIFYGEYGHGTHVAGIAADSNPAVRLLSVRHTFAFRNPPRRPTLETATAFARSFPDAIAYMRRAGVRVVNMSWTVGLKDEYEDQLAANGVPAPQRVEEARRLFAIEAGALREAIAAAPDILFVCSAGNSNDSAAFSGNVPASIDAPNVLTVAAVDQAGDPTSFTSSGPSVDIAASGFRVESFVPGGSRQRWSGTSMASPQVVNAAAKLWAADPSLTVAKVRDLLLSTATRQGGFLLLNPGAAMARLTARRDRVRR